MAFGCRTYLDCAAVWRRWKMHPTWVPGVYSRFVPRKAWVRRLNKFLDVFHFPRNSGFARLCGLRDVHVLPYAGEPRRGLPHEEVRRRMEALPPGVRLQGGPELRPRPLCRAGGGVQAEGAVRAHARDGEANRLFFQLVQRQQKNFVTSLHCTIAGGFLTGELLKYATSMRAYARRS